MHCGAVHRQLCALPQRVDVTTVFPWCLFANFMAWVIARKQEPIATHRSSYSVGQYWRNESSNYGEKG